MIERALGGAALATVIAAAGWRAGSLTSGGALTAVLVGSAAVIGGWTLGLAVIAFFITSSALTAWRRAEKERRTGGVLAKTGPRDAAQVAANGIVLAIAALGSALFPAPPWAAAAWGALAAATADTWATEVGILARGVPRSIVSWAPVVPGTSGGISALGTLAAVGGAAFISLMALAGDWNRAVPAAAFAGGIAGAFADSLLGATVQERRRCLRCDALTERRRHACGGDTRVVGGMRWLGNDGVNALATAAGAAVAASLT